MMKRSMLRTLLFPALMLGAAQVYAEDAQKVRTADIALVTLEPTSSVAAGVKQGMQEAGLIGRFSGWEYRLQTLTPAHLSALPQAPAAIIAALPEEALRKLAAEVDDVPIFNVTLQQSGLRSLCKTNLLHVIASDQMLQDAVAQWREKHPGANVTAVAWHHDFELYAARELNNRFRKANGMPMDSEAWAAWTAVKLVADAVTRTASTGPARLLQFLREDVEFDGNKGVLLDFRATGQLRQPVLLVENGELVGEAPVRGVADIEDLDSLGIKENCTPH